MKYKLIALDLDGTVLKNKNSITQKNKKIIQLLLKKNIKIIITTGRGVKSIEKIAKKIKIIPYNYPIIGFNGAIIFNLYKNAIIKHNPFKLKEVIQIFEIAHNYQIFLYAYSVNNKNIIYINKNNFFFTKLIMFFLKYKIILFNKKYFADQCYKFIASGKEKEIINFQNDILNTYQYNCFLIIHKNKKMNIEISPKNVDKKNALQYLAKIYNIKKSEIMAIGDGMNDFKMLKWVGLGIAMSNANPIIKNIAKDIINNNKKTGVAQTIKKYIKL